MTRSTWTLPGLTSEPSIEVNVTSERPDDEVEEPEALSPGMPCGRRLEHTHLQDSLSAPQACETFPSMRCCCLLPADLRSEQLLSLCEKDIYIVS